MRPQSRLFSDLLRPLLPVKHLSQEGRINQVAVRQQFELARPKVMAAIADTLAKSLNVCCSARHDPPVRMRVRRLTEYLSNAGVVNVDCPSI